ncbi:MAG: hypothetical protein AAFR81_21015 [Chloroflexota bacterium]
MTTTTHIDTHSVVLNYDAVNGIVHHQFQKPVDSQTFRETLTVGAELLIANNATKWLSDDRKNSALSDADSAWAIDEWAPQMIKHGWQHWALVVPEDAAGRQSLVNHVFSYTQRGLNVRVFTDADQALAWLINQG